VQNASKNFSPSITPPAVGQVWGKNKKKRKKKKKKKEQHKKRYSSAVM
jgi:hypothetical protein